MTSTRGDPLREASSGAGRAGWRLAAIALFLGLPLAAAAISAMAITEAVDAAQVADHGEDTARAILHQLQRRLATPQPPVDQSARFLRSANASLARAELQGLAGRLIERGGGRVLEMQSTDGSDADPANHVSVDVTYDTSNAGLLAILYEAETGLPLLTVPRLEAHGDAADGQAGVGQRLHVTMTLQGTWKGAAP